MTGVDGVDSLAAATLVRLRFNDAFVPRAGFSFGVSWATGAASSRARALVDRRGSDIWVCHCRGWDVNCALSAARRRDTRRTSGAVG